MLPINFFYEDVDYRLHNQPAVAKWINNIIIAEGNKLIELNFIFCSDEYLYKINVEYLNHETYTDIITFDNKEKEGELEGDIFISIERVRDNAEQLKLPIEEELHRVIIHGALHLMGYNDKTPEEQEAMREKEETCLSLREF